MSIYSRVDFTFEYSCCFQGMQDVAKDKARGVTPHKDEKEAEPIKYYHFINHFETINLIRNINEIVSLIIICVSYAECW